MEHVRSGGEGPDTGAGQDARPGTDAGRERALRLIGLAARAGTVLAGTERVRDAIRAGRPVQYVIVAADAARHARDKLIAPLEARGIPFVVGYERWQLGAAVGRGPLSAVGLTDESLAASVRRLVEASEPGSDTVIPKPEGSDRGRRERRRER
ncbi:MAG TPA: ribosomal L7Ae/L30e/S12e/Gadd45 family protein [Longimicrobiales bacterium]|nr:ribosomal L7Ae/L30e/S12e/Gadd45 family protein [Longimicrobiales bacterium]